LEMMRSVHRRVGPRMSVLAYSSGTLARLERSEAEEAQRNSNAPHPQRQRSGCSVVNGVVSEASPLADRLAQVAAQIGEMAESIMLVQEQIVQVGIKAEATKAALYQANLPVEKREILVIELKGLMDEKKGLMDKEKGLMDRQTSLINKETSLMDEKRVLMDKEAKDAGRRESWSTWFTDWWKILLSAGFGLAGFAASVATLNKDTNRSLEYMSKRLSNSLADVKLKNQDLPDSSYYVARPALEAKILAVYDKTFLVSGSYCIVYGVKGAGKTSAVKRVLNDKAGVVLVQVSESDTVESIMVKIFEACGEVVDPAARLSKILGALKAAKEKREGRPVTVLFEVERGSSSPTELSLVKHTAKEFALYANVLIVLSEANTVLGFGDDSRQNFILVEEMTREEAEQYVKKCAPSISSEDFNKFANKCGTRPLSLVKFCDAVLAGESVDEHIAKVVDSARGDLEAFIHTPIIAALKKSPGGVLSGSFDGVKHEGVLLSEPKLVAPAMKVRNTIVYDFEAGEYKLFSKAHQTALKTVSF